VAVNADCRDLLRILNACEVRFLIAGAHAVMFHAEPRYTKDLDIWVAPSPENADRVWAALEQFGAPLQDVTKADFTNPELVYQLGIAPNRIDIMMGIPGVRFETAWRNRGRTRYGGVPVSIMSRSDLIRAKRKAGRPQDLMDLSALREGPRRRRPS